MDLKTLTIKKSDNRIIVNITEKRIYLGITDIFREEMISVVENTYDEMIINLENVAVMNSAGLGVLIMARDKIKKINGRIKLTNLQPLMQDIFSRMRLDTLFEIYANVEEACDK
ncbi:STAS domain-containing protein [candidate division KSB1 bacterium]|nr:STAS domain-containing protein [candidate division KSB1 bacterium]